MAVAAATDALGAIRLDKLIPILEDEWITAYYSMSSHDSIIMSLLVEGFTFLYDQACVGAGDADDRVVAAYGWSTPNEHCRDVQRMLEYPLVYAQGKGRFDKGQIFAHSIGGGLDVNLFPMRSELNRGWSKAGKVYRRMERYAASHPGTFVFSRLIYADNTWEPSSLEYGVLMPDGKLWVELFEN